MAIPSSPSVFINGFPEKLRLIVPEVPSDLLPTCYTKPVKTKEPDLYSDINHHRE